MYFSTAPIVTYHAPQMRGEDGSFFGGVHKVRREKTAVLNKVDGDV